MLICIEGNIGAGKTTLAEMLSKKLKAVYLAEAFEENTLLPLFYKDPKKFAFPTEYSFLIERQKQMVHHFKDKAKKANSVTVSDFHFDKSLCFAKANLSKKDSSFYKKHFKSIKETITQPDLVVYLDVETNLLIKNIQKRGRPIEKDLTEDYLQKLKLALDHYYLSPKVRFPLLILSIKEYTHETMELCCQEITRWLSQGFQDKA